MDAKGGWIPITTQKDSEKEVQCKKGETIGTGESVSEIIRMKTPEYTNNRARDGNVHRRLLKEWRLEKI